MNRIKEMYRKNLKKQFDISEIKNKDRTKLQKQMNSYNNMIQKQYDELPKIVSSLGLVVYLFIAMLASTALSLALCIFTLVTIKGIYNYWKIYIQKEKYKNKIYLRRHKAYKMQYIFHIFLGLFGINYVTVILELVFSVVLIFWKKKIENLWEEFDQKNFQSQIEESKYQRRTRLETEIENEYYYNVYEYLKR